MAEPQMNTAPQRTNHDISSITGNVLTPMEDGTTQNPVNVDTWGSAGNPIPVIEDDMEIMNDDEMRRYLLITKKINEINKRIKELET